MRNDEKPFQVPSSSPGRFRVRVNRSYQRVNGCYCASARAGGSGGFREEVGQRKVAERRDKESACAGKDTWSRQDP